MEQKKWIATENGERLDKAIPKLDQELSRASVQRLIEKEKIKVNGIVPKASYILKNGDIITLEKDEPEDTSLKPEDIPIEVIYEDDDIIVVNKPKGLVVHPRKWKQGWYSCKCNSCYM